MAAPAIQTRSQQRLLRVMRGLRFGAVERLHVAGGEPVFDPAPVIVLDIKFGSADRSPRPADPDVLDRHLLDELRRIGDGVIDRIEVHHGRPFRMIRTIPGVPP